MLAEYRPCWNTFPERVPIFQSYPYCQTSWNNMGYCLESTMARPLLKTVPRKADNHLTVISHGRKQFCFYPDMDNYTVLCAQHE